MEPTDFEALGADIERGVIHASFGDLVEAFDDGAISDEGVDFFDYLRDHVANLQDIRAHNPAVTKVKIGEGVFQEGYGMTIGVDGITFSVTGYGDARFFMTYSDVIELEERYQADRS